MTRLSVPVIDIRGARLPRARPVRTAYFSVMQSLAAGLMRMFALSRYIGMARALQDRSQTKPPQAGRVRAGAHAAMVTGLPGCAGAVA